MNQKKFQTPFYSPHCSHGFALFSPGVNLVIFLIVYMRVCPVWCVCVWIKQCTLLLEEFSLERGRKNKQQMSLSCKHLPREINKKNCIPCSVTCPHCQHCDCHWNPRAWAARPATLVCLNSPTLCQESWSSPRWPGRLENCWQWVFSGAHEDADIDTEVFLNAVLKKKKKPLKIEEKNQDFSCVWCVFSQFVCSVCVCVCVCALADGKISCCPRTVNAVLFIFH